MLKALCLLMLSGASVAASASGSIDTFMQSKKVIVYTDKAELCFADTGECHPVLIGKTTERRLERIRSPLVADRIMTNGCINVHDEVYEKLKTYFVLEIL